MICGDHELLARYSAATLPPEQANEVARHLSECPGCAAVAASLRERPATPDTLQPSPPPPSGQPGACPRLDELRAYLSGTLPAESRTQVRDHVAECDDCFERVRQLRQEIAGGEPAAHASAERQYYDEPEYGLPAAGAAGYAGGQPVTVGIPTARQILSHAAVAAAAIAVAMSLTSSATRATDRDASGSRSGGIGSRRADRPGGGPFGSTGGTGMTGPGTFGGGPGARSFGPGMTGAPPSSGFGTGGPFGGGGFGPGAGTGGGPGAGVFGTGGMRPGFGPGGMRPGGPGGPPSLPGAGAPGGRMFGPPPLAMSPGGTGLAGPGASGPRTGPAGPTGIQPLQPAQPPPAGPIMEAVLPLRRPASGSAQPGQLPAMPEAIQKELKSAAEVARTRGPAAAIQELETFLGKAENQAPEAYALLGTLYLKTGNREKAGKAFSDAAAHLQPPPSSQPGDTSTPPSGTRPPGSAGTGSG
jgi:anti-sigma factor RsiW